jgi:hypothetical protein
MAAAAADRLNKGCLIAPEQSGCEMIKQSICGALAEEAGMSLTDKWMAVFKDATSERERQQARAKALEVAQGNDWLSMVVL